MTLIMFELVNNTDKSELLKNVLSINNQSIAVRDYINREKLTYKCYTCNKIGHFTNYSSFNKDYNNFIVGN